METMMQVKKQYEELYAFLEANKNKKVSTILPELGAMMARKSGGAAGGKNFIKDDEGNVIAIYCYYHKQWELPGVAEYGAKASNKATGLNTMCKEGVSAWTKAQRVKKQAEEGLLQRVIDGELKAEDLPQAKEDIAAEATVINSREDGHGYESLEELVDNHPKYSDLV